MNVVDLPELLDRENVEWRKWLSAHHAESRGVRLLLARKGTVQRWTLVLLAASAILMLVVLWIDSL